MQFSWRPRPPSSLSTEKEEEIEKNLKTYSYKYEAEDQDTLMFFNERERQSRKILMEEWSRRILEWKHLREEQKTQSMLRDEVSEVASAWRTENSEEYVKRWRSKWSWIRVYRKGSWTWGGNTCSKRSICLFDFDDPAWCVIMGCRKIIAISCCYGLRLTRWEVGTFYSSRYCIQAKLHSLFSYSYLDWLIITVKLDIQ